MRRTRTFLCSLASLILCWTNTFAQDLISHGPPFTLHVTQVRSLAHDTRVGFSKVPELYAITAYGPKMSYVLYCSKVTPQSGRDYTALDEYVGADYSWLHLWPVEKKDLQLPPGTKKKNGRMYRVIIIQNVAPEPKPDTACDIYSETAKQP